MSDVKQYRENINLEMTFNNEDLNEDLKNGNTLSTGV